MTSNAASRAFVRGVFFVIGALFGPPSDLHSTRRRWTEDAEAPR